MGWWDLVTKWSCAICPQGCVSTFILLECLPQEWFAGLNCSFCQTVCVMVVWRTKVQCDAHGQVGGCKMDSLGWDGWCLLHKSEFFTICLILVEKLYQNTDSLAWRILCSLPGIPGGLLGELGFSWKLVCAEALMWGHIKILIIIVIIIY